MLHFDESALEDRFWETALSYTDQAGNSVTLSDDQKLVQNAPSVNLDETKPWVKFSVVPGDSAIDATGTVPTYQQLGTAFLRIFVPKGMGIGAAKEMRDQFAAAFRGWKSPDGHCHSYRLGFNTYETDASAEVRVTVFWESWRKPN